MPKICEDTNERNAYVIFKGENDPTNNGMGELPRKRLYYDKNLPVVVLRNYNDNFHCFAMTNVSYRIDEEETYKDLKKGQGVGLKTGLTYFFKQKDLDVIKVWFCFGFNRFSDTPLNPYTEKLYLMVPRRDGATPPPDE